MTVEVSVITPMHNDVDTIMGAIGCVQAQTGLSVEHIVVDDGSVDGGSEIVQEAQLRYPNLSFISLGRNRGAAVARNIGIEAARGRYIAFLDSDDIWSPDKLRVQISFMKRTLCALSYGGYWVEDRSNKGRRALYNPPLEVSYERLLLGCPIGCLTAAYDTEVCGKVYMPMVRRGQDWGLWLRITKAFGAAQRYHGILASYRTGKGSLSSRKLMKVADIWKLYKEQEGMANILAVSYMAAHAVYSVSRRLSVKAKMRF